MKTCEEIVIRRIKKGDFEQLFPLIAEGFERQIEIVGLDMKRLQRMAKFYRLISNFMFLFSLLHIDFETILVATYNDKVVGGIHMVPHGRHIWSIDSAAVDKNFRGHGIYRRLRQEAVNYIRKKCGQRIVTSVWADNIAPIKIVLGEMQYDVFATETLMVYEPCEISESDNIEGVRIRDVQGSEVEQIFEICQTAYPKKVRAYGNTPKDFSGSILRRIRKRISGISSKRLAIEVEGEIVGYVHLTYTSPKEAGNIEFLCLLPSVNPSVLVPSLARYVSQFLAEKNIRKVVVSLNEEWKETIEAFQKFGYKPFASVYQLMKNYPPLAE